MQPKVSIIIPCLNEELLLPSLLKDLAHQQYAHTEIIVVDGGSQDQTQALVKKNKKVALIITHAGPGHQRSLGAKKATGEYLLFLDADVRVLDQEFIQNLVHFMENHKLGTACPYYFPYQSLVSIKLVYLFFNLLFFVFQKITPSGAGSGIMTRAEVFTKAGGFQAHLRFDDIAYIRAAARHQAFAMAPLTLHVSDRRFRKYGVIRMLCTYLALSLFFMVGQFKAAEIIEYRFSKY